MPRIRWSRCDPQARDGSLGTAPGGVRHRLRRGFDVALPVLVALFLASFVESQVHPFGLLTVIGGLAGLIQGAALWWRRSHPVTVSAITIVGALIIQLIAPDGVFAYAGLIALFSLAAQRSPWHSAPALLALLGVTSLNYLTSPADDAGFALMVTVLVWALGEIVRNRRVAIDEASRRAVGEEQARIARELHDVIAHSVSVIVVQAAAADDVFDQRPDQARTALRSIEAAGRDALSELRRLLGAVRPEGAQAATGGAPRRPQLEPPGPAPGVDQLAELAAPLRLAGLDVVWRREGSLAALPAGVDRCAYRIVQEALTNTLRHAGAQRADVVIRRRHDVLDVEIVDDGPLCAGASPGNGRGIVGMRERAALLGGTLDAGPLPEGGFRVHARLPVAAAR